MGKVQQDHIVTGVLTLVGGIACLLLSMKEGRKFSTVLGYTILAAAIAVTASPIIETKWGIPKMLTIAAISGFGYIWIPLVEKDLPSIITSFVKKKLGLGEADPALNEENKTNED